MYVWLLLPLGGCAPPPAVEAVPAWAQMPEIAGCTHRVEYHDELYIHSGKPWLVEARYDELGRLADTVWADLETRGLDRSWFRSRSAWDEEGCLVRTSYDAAPAGATPSHHEEQWRCALGQPEARRLRAWTAGVLVLEEFGRVRVEVEDGNVVYQATEDPRYGWVGSWSEWGDAGRVWRQTFNGDTIVEEERWEYDEAGRVTLYTSGGDTPTYAERTGWDELGRPAWVQRSWVRDDGPEWYLYRYVWSDRQYTLERVETSGSAFEGVVVETWACTEGWPWTCEVHTMGTDGQEVSGWRRDGWSCEGPDAPGASGPPDWP